MVAPARQENAMDLRGVPTAPRVNAAQPAHFFGSLLISSAGNG
jgi:hypothetical protein